MADAATAILELPHEKIQMSGGANLRWWFESFTALHIPPAAPNARYQNAESGAIGMYARLAREYDAEPAVRDRRGGAPGDRYRL